MNSMMPCDTPAADGRCCLPHWRQLTGDGPRPDRDRPRGRDVEFCSHPDCDQVASVRGLCQKHYRELIDSKGPRDDHPLRVGVAYDLNPQELDELRRRVEADAVPLFILAMNWCVSQALTKAVAPTRSRA